MIDILLALLAAEAVPATRAHADLGSYFHIGDYPVAASMRAETGSVGFTLDVGADGRVGGCRVTASSGSEALDTATCRILAERAQFTPARDAAGNAVTDQFSSRIVWTLPDPPTGARARAALASYVADGDYPLQAMRKGEQGTVGFELDVSPQGRVVACRILESSGSRLLDVRTCQIMFVRARFTPGSDAAGHPAPDTVTGRIRWVLPED
jgi:TonB family protein